MKILIFWDSLLFYHAARIYHSYRLALRNGHHLVALSIRNSPHKIPIPDYQLLLDKELQILSQDFPANVLNSKHAAYQLLSVLDTEIPDVVAIPGYDGRVQWTALGWCRRHRRGAVLMTESQRRDFPRSNWKEWLKRGLLKFYDAALAGGKPQVAYLGELGMPLERVFTGYDAVDNKFFATWAEQVRQDSLAWRDRLHLPECFFLTACRLVPKKNLDGLLRAYAKYTSQVEEIWPLVIVGDGPLRVELESLAQTLGISQQVRFLGYLSAEEMGPVYGLASVFILASAYAEQWGLVVNEAMAAGLPVIVSHICGCAPDLVQHGITGFQFDPNIPEQLTQFLLTFGTGQVDIKKMGNAAQIMIQKFSAEHFAINFLKASEIAFVHADKRSHLVSRTFWRLLG